MAPTDKQAPLDHLNNLNIFVKKNDTEDSAAVN
jgi:hypothetical protein